MAFAIVHFTVGFVSILTLLWLVPLTRYRLTGAFLGGIWGLVPDASKIFDESLGEWFVSVHNSSTADLFFFHYTLDQPFFRAHNIELTFFAFLTLGTVFVLYDWQFGQPTRSERPPKSSETVDRDQDRL